MSLAIPSGVWSLLMFMATANLSTALLRRFSTTASLRRRGLAATAEPGSGGRPPSSSSSSLVTIADLRQEYSSHALTEDDEDVQKGPIHLFQRWLDEACTAKLTEPNAMCLATCVDNKPTARFVLLKGFDESGFVWFTNYLSTKGEQLSANPHAALTFWWAELQRQVRVEGTVERVSDEASDKYFSVRPRGSQLGAWSSKQSRPIDSRSALEEQERSIHSSFSGDQPVPRPPHWGGFRLVPSRIEFWKGRGSRLHDRLSFGKEGDSWKLTRLQP